MVIDKAVLGSHRDGVIWNPDGTWSWNEGYQYTWILSSLNFIVRVWCKSADYWEVNWALTENGKKALDRAGIEIPFPQVDVHSK